MLNSFVKSGLLAKRVAYQPGFMQLMMTSRFFSAMPTVDYNRKYRGNFDLMMQQGAVAAFTANNLWGNPGARRIPKQVGRGPGSGKG